MFVAPAGGGSQNFGVQVGRMTAAIFLLPEACTVDRLGIAVTTAAVGGVARLGVYSATGGRPSSLLLDAGTVGTDTAGNKIISGLSLALGPGLYFAVAGNQVGAASLRGVPVNQWPPFLSCAAVPGGNISVYDGGFPYMDGVTGALPAVFTLSVTAPILNQQIIRVYYGVA